jgi:hypothetical protein
MRHYPINNFRGIERFADVANLDRGSLSQAVNSATLPRGAISSGPIWRNVSGLSNYQDAFKKHLDWVQSAFLDAVEEYDRARVGFPHTQYHVLSNKGALFMAGNPENHNRVYIAEPANKRENIMDGLDSSIMSYVDILNVGDRPYTPRINALSVYGSYILAHHDYGITALLDVDTRNDPVTGYRVPQLHTPASVGAANHACAWGDVYLGTDGQVYQDYIEASPPDKHEQRAERSPSYKSAGGYEHLLASGWQTTAFSQWVSSLGLFVFFVKLAATNDFGYFFFHRPTLTLSGPFDATGAAEVGLIQGTDIMVVRNSSDVYAYTDLGEFHDKDITPPTSPVTPPNGLTPATITGVFETNWEDLGDNNVHKTIEELQLNFKYGSAGNVSIEVENEEGLISGSAVNWQSIEATGLGKERIKAFLNLYGRRFKIRVHTQTTHGRPWFLHDMSVGFTPGVEL